MMSDSFRFDLHCAPLGLSLQVAMSEHEKATHYAKDSDRLVLFWNPTHPDAIPLPVPMGMAELEPVIRTWLSEEAEYGPEEDTDGHCRKSWRVHNGSGSRITAGTVDYGWGSFAAIEPEWAVYGK